MELHLNADLEAKLARVAAAKGHEAEVLAQRILADHLAEEERFIEAAKLGEADFDKGDYLTQAQVEASMAELVRD